MEIEQQLWQVLDDLEKMANEYAVAKATLNALKRKEKREMALLKADSNLKTVSAREEEALASPEYEDLRGRLFTEEANSILVITRFETLEKRFDLLRSLGSWGNKVTNKTT